MNELVQFLIVFVGAGVVLAFIVVLVVAFIDSIW